MDAPRPEFLRMAITIFAAQEEIFPPGDRLAFADLDPEWQRHYLAVAKRAHEAYQNFPRDLALEAQARRIAA